MAISVRGFGALSFVIEPGHDLAGDADESSPLVDLLPAPVDQSHSVSHMFWALTP